jgi:anaerobic selenocysteine-containing dehydrogenase
VRNVANFSPPVRPLGDGLRDESEIVLRLAAIVAGLGPDADIDGLTEGEQLRALAALAGADTSPVSGHDVAELRATLSGDTAAERQLDLMLRTGPYGDWFGTVPDGLSVARLRDHPHGIDLGPLQPRIPEVLRTSSGRIELCPDPIADEVRRLGAPPPRDREFVVIGRRHLRSNNSWLHNVPALVKGRPLCTIVVNSADAKRLLLVAGGRARVTSRVGQVELPVEVTDDISPGVVSIPHGWGHDLPAWNCGGRNMPGSIATD